MTAPSPKEIAQLLDEWSNGDRAALDKLIPLVYQELHRIAGKYMKRERAGHTLQTTALIHEAYLKLVGERNMRWRNRNHFLAVAAHLMRNILVDYARARRYAKRGGGAIQVPLDGTLTVSRERSAELIALDDALKSLAKIDDRQSQVAEMKLFGGLKEDEIAEALGVSSVTVRREWRVAKAWLRRELSKTVTSDE
jgi:RNA polymerase sigma factor (TIGR02999 family)